MACDGKHTPRRRIESICSVFGELRDRVMSAHGLASNLSFPESERISRYLLDIDSMADEAMESLAGLKNCIDNGPDGSLKVTERK